MNRTVRIAKRPAESPPAEPNVGGDLADAETRLAGMTRELALAAERCSGQRCEPLYQAEDAMLASAASLGDRAFQKAGAQQQDALAYLIKARDTLRVVLGKSDQAAMQAFRNFDRMQMQKLRPPRDEQEDAAQLASQLRQLADKEDIVYETLSGVKMADLSRPLAPKATPSQQSPDSGRPAETDSAARTGKGSSVEKKDESLEGRKPATDRNMLEELQQQIVDEAHELQRTMQDFDDLTQLAHTRMDRAAERADAAFDALSRGDAEEAAQAAREAAPMFRELADHVTGLLADDAAGKVAASRDAAQRLAQGQRQLGNEASGADEQLKPPSSSDGQSSATSASRSRARSSTLADRAARLAESGRTLKDLLKALADSSDKPSDAVQEIQRILADGELDRALERMKQLADLLRNDDADLVRIESREIAEYLDALSMQLDSLHRLIVAPRIEQLRALAERAADLRERLRKLDSRTGVDQWHRDAEALTRDLADVSAADAVDGLLDAMRDAGWGDVERWGNRSLPGPLYGSFLGQIVQSLHQHIRELLLRDLMASGEEAAPLEYRALVDRYFEVLSEDKRIQ